MRKMIVSVAACLLVSTVYAADSASSAPVSESAQPDATVTLKGGSVAVGIGYTWGHGDLEYGSGSHRFTIKGVSIVDVGGSGFNAHGQVFHLKKLEDFAGTYAAAGAGLALGEGGTAVYLRNEHGVVIKLLAKDEGLKFKLSADGVHVALKK